MNLIESFIKQDSSDTNGARRKGRRRDKKGGALVKVRKRNSKLSLPSIYLADVRSLCYKMDELNCLIHTRKDSRECCAFFITESWLDDSTADAAMTPPGFAFFRHNRLNDEVDEETGRGVCFMIHLKWCTDTNVLSTTCTPDPETLTVKCRPFYLPREFPSLILTVACIHCLLYLLYL